MNRTVETGSLVMGLSTSIMAFITQNATAITVLCTFTFGLVYASCAIWNAWINHSKMTQDKRKIIDELVHKIQVLEEVPQETIEVLLKSLRNVK